MRFLQFKYRDYDPNLWDFSDFELRKLNLLVGQTSAGKTRLLNSIFNLGFSSLRQKVNKYGIWHARFKTNGKNYLYKLEVRQKGPSISKEILTEDDGSTKREIVKRDEQTFYFNDTLLPRLPSDQTSIRLLADEERIRPIADGFGRIQKRLFDQDELNKASQLSVVDRSLESLLHEKQSLLDLWKAEVSLSLKLYYLKTCFSARYSAIVKQFMEVFPSITNCDIVRLKRENIPFETKGVVPVFVISEKRVKDRISVGDLSSGMKKVLLILTDIVSAPEGTVYLIDEYENSLGVNAIDFLPSFILDYESSIQFIISTHHPYLINEIGMDNWLLLTRNGSQVSITRGIELKKRYGMSKQQAFTQLVNDPLYFHSD